MDHPHAHPLSLRGPAPSQFRLEHEHERGDEPHTHAVTPDGQRATSTEFEVDGPVARAGLVEQDPVRAALLVLTETPETRDWLLSHDPQALLQAQGALRATEAAPALPLSDRTVTVKRRYAVVLEDAIRVPVPAHLVDDPEELTIWARENSDALWQQACEYRDAREVGHAAEMDRMASLGYATWLWENEHHADVDSIDEEYDIVLDAPE